MRLLSILEEDLSFTDAFTGYRQPKKGAPFRLDQIIDVPHFSRSHLSVMIQIADWAAYTVRTHLVLSVYGAKEAYAGEKHKFSQWYGAVMARSMPPTATCPPGKDPVCSFFREHVRPSTW